jgi:hypothetical protein
MELEAKLVQGKKAFHGKEVWVYGIGNSMDSLQNGLKLIDFPITGYCVDREYLGGGYGI